MAGPWGCSSSCPAEPWLCHSPRSLLSGVRVSPAKECLSALNYPANLISLLASCLGSTETEFLFTAKLTLNSQLPTSSPGDCSQQEEQSGISGALCARDAMVSPCRQVPPGPFPAKQLSLEHGPDNKFPKQAFLSPPYLASFLP